MRIEKISENQIKFLLSKSDLVERDIKITELAYGSDKTQELFREMMEQAMEECGFEAESSPLMIEAIPVTQESIMIMVTKVKNSEYVENKYDILPRAKDQDKYKKKTLSDIKNNVFDKKALHIYSFKNIDNILDLSKRIVDKFEGETSLYKYNDQYYLIMESTEMTDEISEIEAISNEYGTKHVSDTIAKFHIIEHGEPLLRTYAVKELSKI